PPVLKDRGKPSTTSSFAAADAPAEKPEDQWKKFRYVKMDGLKSTPLMADAIDKPEDQYNLMPFRLLLTVDGRYLDKLLVALRNSALPVEVQQVRMNPQATSGATMGGGVFPTGPRGGTGEHDAAGGVRVGGATDQPQTHNQTVEIHGVVYLLKPPTKADA